GPAEGFFRVLCEDGPPRIVQANELPEKVRVWTHAELVAPLASPVTDTPPLLGPPAPLFPFALALPLFRFDRLAYIAHQSADTDFLPFPLTLRGRLFRYGRRL